jgi:hypothetical protein
VGNAAGSGAAQTGSCGLGLLVPQVPFEDEALTFGVAGDPLAVAAELGSWGGSCCSRPTPRWRSSSMRRPSPKTPCTLVGVFGLVVGLTIGFTVGLSRRKVDATWLRAVGTWFGAGSC